MTALDREIVACNRCPRLVAWREEVARVKRRAYRDQEYWGRPVPAFGPLDARLLVVGLAPGAHGANRTGRMFTGDRSGDFLYRALFENGFATQPTSTHIGDGLALIDCRITAPVHCVPPDNKPTREEIEACGEYLVRELHLMPRVGAVVALGRIALESYCDARGMARLKFAHGAVYPVSPPVIASYHPSQQNTQTGRLSAEMLAAVFREARRIIG
ncbi:MAG: uracil-DNA glycosylase [Bryobacteraceae bacterium]|nr:uracil-DNA glycosylase [Bryobacteraceae bacterium]